MNLNTRCTINGLFIATFLERREIMQVYELNIKIKVINEIQHEHVLREVSKVIDTALAKDAVHLDLHKKNTVKYYCLDGLYPVEADGIYQKDKIYTFHLRTIDLDLGKYLIFAITDTETANLAVASCEVKLIPPKVIAKVYSITPIVIRTENKKYWKNEISFADYCKIITDNLLKKYKSYTNEEVDESIPLFTAISFTNQKPIKFAVKGIYNLADKLDIDVETNPLAQKIWYMSLGTGLGNLNARGAGYLNYKWL